MKHHHHTPVSRAQRVKSQTSPNPQGHDGIFQELATPSSGWGWASSVHTLLHCSHSHGIMLKHLMHRNVQLGTLTPPTKATHISQTGTSFHPAGKQNTQRRYRLGCGQDRQEADLQFNRLSKRVYKSNCLWRLPTTSSFSTLHPGHMRNQHEGQAKPLTGPGSSNGSR